MIIIYTGIDLKRSHNVSIIIIKGEALLTIGYAIFGNNVSKFIWLMSAKDTFIYI